MCGNEGHKCKKGREHPYYGKKYKDQFQMPFMDRNKETISGDGRNPFLMQMAEAAETWYKSEWLERKLLVFMWSGSLHIYSAV